MGLNAFYYYQLFALDFVVVKTHRKMFGLHGCFLSYAMYNHGVTVNQINHDETKTRGSQPTHSQYCYTAGLLFYVNLCVAFNSIATLKDMFQSLKLYEAITPPSLVVQFKLWFGLKNSRHDDNIEAKEVYI